MRVDLGNLPTWFAFAAATVAAVCTWRALVRERKRDVKRDGRESRAQADLVAGWIAKENVPHFLPRITWVARVGNQSALPVYQVCVVVTMAPGWSPHHVFDDNSGVTIPPGSTWDVVPVTEEMSYHSVSDLRIKIQFTDCAGKRWNRDERGQLSQVTT